MEIAYRYRCADWISRCHLRVLCFITLSGQASEGMWGMPGHTEARKAAVSCEKPWGAAHTH